MNPATSSRWPFKPVLRRLVLQHGARRWECAGKAVDVLVATILSQSTHRANSTAGFHRLRERFATWDDVAEARTDQIERCIRVSGLSRRKAPRIKRALREIRADQGRIDLEFLRRRPVEEADRYLLRLEGVGPKTASCVLMFSFNMPVFPVDTHIHRIAARLGLIDAGTVPEKACHVLTPLIAPADRYAAHVLLVAHGRSLCQARQPRCADCRLLQLCPFGRHRMEASAS